MRLNEPKNTGAPDDSAAWALENSPLVLAILSQANMTFWAAAGVEDNFAIRLWGPGAERIYGYTQEQALGRSYIDLIVNRLERQRAIEDHARIIETDEVYDWDWAADDLTASGEVRTMLTHCFRIKDPSDDSWLLAELGIDISDFNRASQQLRQVREVEYQRQEMTLARAIGQIGQAVAAVGREGGIESVGAAILTATRDAVRSIDHAAVWLDDDQRDEPVAEAVAPNKKGFPFDATAARAAALDSNASVYFDPDDNGGLGLKLSTHERRGRKRSFAIVPLRSFQTRPLGAIAIALSSNRRIEKVERERLETIAAFAGPLLSVAQELERTRREEARRLLIEQKQLVIRSVLHTVGNEVYTLQGYADQLASKIGEVQVPTEVNDLLAQVRAQSDQLDVALQELRNELESPDSKEPVPLQELVDSILNPLRGRYRSIEFTTEIDQRHTALIVQSWLAEIVRNLVGNAVQILMETDAGGDVAVRSSTRQDGFVELHIEDSGPGVAEAVRGTLFEKGVSTRLNSGGTGRGLHVARDLARGGGGEVTLLTAPSSLGGAHFRVDLPADPSLDLTR